MEDKALIYADRFKKSLKEVQIHLLRIDQAFEALGKKYNFPLSPDNFHTLLQNSVEIAYADQIIYRFSKAQDSIGAKLFKAFLLYQGENVDRPFLDILNSLERIHIINIDQWFELREIRNEIAHDYENNEEHSNTILNSIYKHKDELRTILSIMDSLIK